MNLRLDPLEWARASAEGLPGLDWVDGDLRGPDMAFVPDEDGRPRFRGPLPQGLPPAMLEAAIEAREAGELPMAEALMALLARPAWLVACRDLLWSPMSPCPALLTERVESLGLDVELHRHDPARLARLTARAPAWHAGRGTPAAALALLERALGEQVHCRLVSGDQATAAELAGELCAARSGSWWAARAGSNARHAYRVQEGFVRCQALSDAPAPQPREDVFVVISAGSAPPTGLLRLLPAGVSLRLVVSSHAK